MDVGVLTVVVAALVALVLRRSVILRRDWHTARGFATAMLVVSIAVLATASAFELKHQWVQARATALVVKRRDKACSGGCRDAFAGWDHARHGDDAAARGWRATAALAPTSYAAAPFGPTPGQPLGIDASRRCVYGCRGCR